jgi:hypothetical protein
MRALDHHLRPMRWLWENCRTRYLVVVAGAPCQESQSSRGKAEGPSSAAAVEGTEMVEDQLVERTPQLKMTASVGVPEGAHSLTLKLKHRSRAVVVLAVADTSQSVPFHAVAVDQAKHSMYCLDEAVAVVAGSRAKNWTQNARRP